MPLQIEIDEGRKAFEPGGKLTGTATWQLAKAPRAVGLRLFWYTSGQGAEDAGLVEIVRFDTPKTDDKRSFRLRLPDGPYSFSGQLIWLLWALELVAEPSKETARIEIIIAPGGHTVQLDALPKWESGG